MEPESPKNVFLTGASSGIGLETGKRLAQRGHEVWGTSRDATRLPELARFHRVEMDLLQPESIRTGFDRAIQQAGAFDVLINNAGAGRFGPLEKIADEAIRDQWQLLVHAPLELIRLALPKMREQGRGLIINVSSLAARFPIPFMAPYSVSKAALTAMSAALRVELAHTPIQVVDLQPGDTQSSFHAATKRLEIEADEAYRPRVDAAWNVIDRHMRNAPSSSQVAGAIVRIIDSPNPPPVVKVGSFFQARVAPFLARLGSQRMVEWVLQRYYGI